MCTDGRLQWAKAARGGRYLVAVAACLLVVAATADDTEQDIAAAITSGKTGVALRYRYEHVDQDGFDDRANASTVRLRFNHGTTQYRKLSAFVEFDYVAELILDDYNSGDGTNAGRTRYPVVADPDGGDLNQLYVDWQADPQTRMRIGRQRILLDNQRFVGGVGWRQNEQTYDAVTVHYSGFANVDLQYSWVGRVNRIFGDRAGTAGRHDNNTHLLNASVALKDGWRLAPYGYFIDNEDLPAFSTATIGARLAGGLKLGERPLSLTAEVATQSDAHGGPVNYSANYWRFDVNLAATENLDLFAGYERLGGDSNEAGAAFRTPLATLHGFNGWADRFLATPDEGLVDRFGGLRATRNGWTLHAIYHDFASDAGDTDPGRELDLSLARRIGDRYGVMLKVALFEGDDLVFSDTRKAWLMLTADY